LRTTNSIDRWLQLLAARDCALQHRRRVGTDDEQIGTTTDVAVYALMTDCRIRAAVVVSGLQ